MNIRNFISAFFVLALTFVVKANNISVSVDSFEQRFVEFGQKKIQLQMEQNQTFAEKGLLDSINYVINIDSKSLFTEGGLSAEFIQEYIPTGISTSSIINSPQKLDDLNKKLLEINKNRTIKTYMLLVNYVELKFKESFNIKDVQEAFYQIGNKEGIEKKVVENAQAKSAQILEDISKPIVKGNVTTPFLYMT